MNAVCLIDVQTVRTHIKQTHIHTNHAQKHSTHYCQGSYRILTVVFQTFPGQNYFFFQTFQGTLFIFMWTKNITKLAFKLWNFLYNAWL